MLYTFRIYLSFYFLYVELLVVGLNRCTGCGGCRGGDGTRSKQRLVSRQEVLDRTEQASKGCAFKRDDFKGTAIRFVSSDNGLMKG